MAHIRADTLYQRDKWDALNEKNVRYPLRTVIGGSDLANSYFDESQKALFSRDIPHEGSLRVLDYGCGVGRWAFWFAETAGEVVGVDISPKMIETAQRRAEAERRTNTRFMVLRDPLPLPFPDNHFDLVNVTWVLKYLLDESDAMQTVREIARVTQPGGRVVLTEQVDRNGPRFVDREGHFPGGAVYRSPDAYIEGFARSGMDCTSHTITSASPLFWSYALARAVFRRGTDYERVGMLSRWLVSLSVRGDLLTGKAMRFRNGHHMFCFVKREV
jgi:ubiquinone/menaquinone biosynthesis C-methylase UbiE